MTVLTLFPDAHPETNSVDGRAWRTGVSLTWANIHDGAGTDFADDAATFTLAYISSTATSPEWDYLIRSIMLFYTAVLADGDIINSVTLEVVATLRATGIASQSINIVATTPASNTAVAPGDYQQPAAGVAQATAIAVADFTVDSATYNVFTLNATGRGNISKPGVSKFGARFVSDINNLAPSWVSATTTRIDVASAEEILVGDKRPRLVIDYTPVFTPRAMVF